MTNIRRWTSVLLLAVSRSCRRQDRPGRRQHSVCRARRRLSSGPDMPSRWEELSVLGPFRDYAPPSIIKIDLSARPRSPAPPVIISAQRFSLNGFQRHGGSRSGVESELRVPAGMRDRGCSVNVEGLRVSVHESGIETLDARISTVENRLTSREPGHSGHRRRAADAIVVDPLTDPVYTYSSGRVLVDPLGHFTFSEGFAEAFSDDTAAGRTVPHRRSSSRRPSLPRNTQLRFPARIEIADRRHA